MWSDCRLIRLIADCNIQMESTHNLVQLLRGGMQIFVRMLSNKMIKFKFESSDNIENLKHKIQDMECIPPDQQCLILVASSLRMNSLRMNSLRMDSFRTNVP